ncbi:MAG: ubiquitin-conjugating enzyme E2 [Candidatus Methanoplasma sp.]|jgi:ubiquitin-protein ligase|nr:ubiquitin-conjugating enzyme E2 [Candidatus Methanoplasma sp.]
MGLVRPVLIRRLNNEIKDLNDYLHLGIPSIPADAEFPIELQIGLGNTPAKISRNETGTKHIFALIISLEYPYERPRAKWLTPIFHPNIMMPEDGGYVCVKTLDNWSFGSSLLSFVKGVEQLISDPNPNNPYGTDSCMEAAKWYSSNRPKFEAKVNYGGRNA